MNDHLTQSGISLSKDPETEGLDLQAAQTWIYPTNYPVRDYQFNIVQKALLKNTLVSLPTGLGKTFIAAVVMYNFFRWYPQGKIIFMAPTRPLVKQQVDACYDIMGIPKEATAEITGTKSSAELREQIWNDKRVFFITPQILQNDLAKIKDLGAKIKCLVFDEAHKARGNYAYCEVIRALQPNKFFRVLALSATPGGTISDVLEVIQNLLISHLEFRTEESTDVKPYVFRRNLTTVVVPLGDRLQQFKDEYLQVLDQYTRNLIKYKVIQGNCASLTKGKMFMTMKQFQQTSKSHPNYAEIMKTLNICVTLYHAFELLVRHGLRSFAGFYEGQLSKPLLRGIRRLVEIVDDVNKYLGPVLKPEPLPDGTYTEIPKDVKFGHPKFYKLRDILVSNFQVKGDSSRVIVFFEYRDSVKEAFALIQQSKPLLKPQLFLGQKDGITQRHQLNVVNDFRDGKCNVLLSTCIGEEGLDVGEVDLIVCFDISNKSPIRMVQRMGRTGRKKEGSIIVLVTEGKEQQTLKDCLMYKNNVTSHVLTSREIEKGLISSCPTMLTAGLEPKCEKIYVTVKKSVAKKTGTLKDMFKRASDSSSTPTFSPDLELVEIEERLPPTEMLWNRQDPLNNVVNPLKIFGKKIAKQRSFQEGHRIKHSKDSEMLVTLLQLADSKRFNIPMSQMERCSASQTSSARNMRQADIRNMFFRSHSSKDFDIPPTQVPVKENPPSEDKASWGSKELHAEISSYLSIQDSELSSRCRHCPGNIDCEKFPVAPKPASCDWVELDASVFRSITAENLRAFRTSLRVPETEQEEFAFDNDLDFDTIEIPSPKSQDGVDKRMLTDIFEKSVNFEAPKSLKKLMDEYSESFVHSSKGSQEILNKNAGITCQKLSDLQKLPEMTPAKSNKSSQKALEPKPTDVTPEEILRFFKCLSLADILGNSDTSGSQQTIIYSPDMFGDSPVPTNSRFTKTISDESIETSPILTSKRRINFGRPNLKRLKRNIIDIESPSNFTTNQNKASSTPLSTFKTNGKSAQIEKSQTRGERLKMDSVCDLASFGLDTNKSRSPGESSTGLSKVVAMSESFKVEDFRLPVTVSGAKAVDANAKTNSNLSSDSFEDLCDTSLLQDLQKSKAGSKTVQTVTNNSSDLDKTLDDLVPEKPIGVKDPGQAKPYIPDDMHDFFDASIFESVTAIRPNGSLNSTLPSQLSITQMLSFINKDDRRTVEKDSRPQNVNKTAYFDDDVFNFSFNTKKTPGKKSAQPKTPLTNRQQPASTGVKTNACSSAGLSEKMPSNLLNKVSLPRNNSDEDFVTNPTGSPSWIKPRALPKKAAVEEASTSSAGKKRIIRDFIDDEADLSMNENVFVSDDENEENLDRYEASFLADQTEAVDTQMHARYLQSVRSPVINRGIFRPPQRPNINVFSQEVQQDETYLDDSFCVGEDEVESHNELSELEIMEMELERRRRKRKSQSDTAQASKRRRRIIEIADDDD